MTKPLGIIIGPGEGLGRALAAKFAGQGFDLALVSRSEKNCAHAIEAVEENSGTARFFFGGCDSAPDRRIGCSGYLSGDG